MTRPNHANLGHRTKEKKVRESLSQKYVCNIGHPSEVHQEYELLLKKKSCRSKSRTKGKKYEKVLKKPRRGYGRIPRSVSEIPSRPHERALEYTSKEEQGHAYIYARHNTPAAKVGLR